MAGGKGTRLRPFTNVLPKPLVPIGEISILELVLRQLHHFGFSDITICVGHKAELIMAVIGDGMRFSLNVRYHHEVEPLGTVGALGIMDGLEENFLVMNGDICTNLDFGALLSAHVRTGAVATIGTYARREKIELGVLEVDEEGRVSRFIEKPTYDFLVSMGVNAFHRSVVDQIPRGEFFGFDSLMLRMIERGEDVRPFRFEGLWHDIGRPDDYQRMLDDFGARPELFLPPETH